MKKLIAILMLLALTEGSAFAAQRGTPEYEKLKEMKKANRELKMRTKAEPSAKAKGFWEREAERSGFAGTGAMFSNALSHALPLDAPNSRKNK